MLDSSERKDIYEFLEAWDTFSNKHGSELKEKISILECISTKTLAYLSRTYAFAVNDDHGALEKLADVAKIYEKSRREVVRC